MATLDGRHTEVFVAGVFCIGSAGFYWDRDLGGGKNDDPTAA